MVEESSSSRWNIRWKLTRIDSFFANNNFVDMVGTSCAGYEHNCKGWVISQVELPPPRPIHSLHKHKYLSIHAKNQTMLKYTIVPKVPNLVLYRVPRLRSFIAVVWCTYVMYQGHNTIELLWRLHSIYAIAINKQVALVQDRSRRGKKDYEMLNECWVRHRGWRAVHET